MKNDKKYKDIWNIKVGDRILVNTIEHTITDTSNVVKPNPMLIGKCDDGYSYEITGNVHNDTEFEVLN